MPELPEVESVVRALRRRLKGRVLGRPTVWQPAVVDTDLREFARRTKGATVLAIRRRGKWILVDLSGDFTLMVHLRMTGQLRLVATDSERAKHDHLQWPLDGEGRCLRFCDQRRFGRLRVMPTEQIEPFLTSRGWGPEPLAIDAQAFHARLGRGSRSIKAALLDQSVVAGLGNIYADEILFAARVDPRTPTREIGRVRAGRIHSAMIEILRRAVAAQGTSLQNYVSVDGRPGRFRTQLQVFRRQGESCLVCGGAITRIRLAGRSTHLCRRCQRR